MYKTIQIRNFKSINDLILDDASHFNIITGPNNLGKTSILEALFMHGAGGNALSVELNTEGQRGLRALSPTPSQAGRGLWDAVFSKLDDTTPVEVTVKTTAGHTRTVSIHTPKSTKSIQTIAQSLESGSDLSLVRSLQIDVADDNHMTSFNVTALPDRIQVDNPVTNTWPVVIQNPMSVNYDNMRDGVNRAIETGTIQDLIGFLKEIDDRTTDIRLQVYGGITLPHVATKEVSGGVPIHLMGAGYVYALFMAMNATLFSGGVFCLDEFQYGLHFTSIERVIQTIARRAQTSGTQVFATTHSDEAISAALRAFSGNEDLRVYRLERLSDGKVLVHTYDLEAAIGSQEIGLSLR